MFEILNDIYNITVDKELISNEFMNLTKLLIRKNVTDYNINNIKVLYNITNTIHESNINELSYNIVISLVNFKNCFSGKHPVYANNQHDCREFIRVFLNDLNKEKI